VDCRTYFVITVTSQDCLWDVAPSLFYLASGVGQSESGLRIGKGKQRCCKDAGERKKSSTGMPVGGGRRQSIHRFHFFTPYHFIAVPSALTETKFQRKKLEIGLCEDSHEVHLANRNRRNSASYDGLSSLLQFVLQFTDSKVFRHFRHPWAVVLSLVQAQTL